MWTPDPPRDIVTTLWAERIAADSEEFNIGVSESSVLGPDLARPVPATSSAEAPKSYHIVENQEKFNGGTKSKTLQKNTMTPCEQIWTNGTRKRIGMSWTI